MERKCAAVGIVVAIGLLALGGCSGTPDETTQLKGQVEQLQITLEKTRNERDLLQQDVQSLKNGLDEAESKLAGTTEAKNAIQSQLQDLTRSRDDLRGKVEQFSTTSKQLQQRVDELTASRDQLQTMVEGLVDTRGTLEKQVATLTRARDAARADAVSAQTKIDQINDKLKTQTQQMVDLQDQMKTIRSVLQQLQQKLE